MKVVESTISGNNADDGGGISIGTGNAAAISGSGSIELKNLTVAANDATGGGGGLYLGRYGASPYNAPTIPVSSTIVGDNDLNGAPNDLATASASSGGFALGNSLVEEQAGARVTEAPAASNIFGQDPGLFPLAANGGPTQTHGLLNSSPAIDTGVANGDTTDQRGQPRTVPLPPPDGAGDGTDIGAYELQALAAPETSIDSGPNGTIESSSATFAFSGTFDQPGPLTFECSVDGGPFEPCSSPRDVNGLADGNHTFQVRAIAGGIADPTPAERMFTVSPPALNTKITKSPKKKVKTKKGKVAVKIEFTASGEGATFECKVDKGKYVPCKSPYTTPKLKAKKGKGAKHTVSVRAIGANGVVDPTPATTTFKLIKKSKKKK